MKIAVCIDAEEQVQPLAGYGQIGLYHYVDAEREWQLVASLPFDFTMNPGLDAMRQQLILLLKQLQDAGCRDLVAQQMHGFVRSIIDGFSVRMWRLDGAVLPALQQSRAAAEQHPVHAPAPSAGGDCRGRHATSQANAVLAPEQLARVMPRPTEDGQPGCYQLNLAESLAASGMNSQQLLLPFLHEQTFRQLHLWCDHPPRWLARELAMLGLQLQRLSDDDALIHLLVTPLSLEQRA